MSDLQIILWTDLDLFRHKAVLVIPINILTRKQIEENVFMICMSEMYVCMSEIFNDRTI